MGSSNAGGFQRKNSKTHKSPRSSATRFKMIIFVNSTSRSTVAHNYKYSFFFFKLHPSCAQIPCHFFSSESYKHYCDPPIFAQSGFLHDSRKMTGRPVQLLNNEGQCDVTVLRRFLIFFTSVHRQFRHERQSVKHVLPTCAVNRW